MLKPARVMNKRLVYRLGTNDGNQLMCQQRNRNYGKVGWR